jgi:hypothetical protein
MGGSVWSRDGAVPRVRRARVDEHSEAAEDRLEQAVVNSYPNYG